MIDGVMKNAIAAVSQMDEASGLSRSIIVAEECAELTKELMKKERKKGSDRYIIEEACDVLASVFILLHTYGVSEDTIRTEILYKYNRAIERYKNTGEL